MLENIGFNDVDKYDDASCVFMFLTWKHSINVIFIYSHPSILLYRRWTRHIKRIICNLHRKQMTLSIFTRLILMRSKLQHIRKLNIHVINWLKESNIHAVWRYFDLSTSMLSKWRTKFSMQRMKNPPFTASQLQAVFKRFPFKRNEYKW